MKRIWLVSSLLVSLLLPIVASRVQALPGQTPEEAELWIQSNSTLRPSRGEKLLVRKSDTPAQRFMFQASTLQVGRAAPGPGTRVIRTEEISLFDMLNGVDRSRLEESLRVIYGPMVYQDYAQARVVYTYPNPSTTSRSVNQSNPLLASVGGEVREGDRYAYWLEIARRQNGVAYTGKMTVFLRADLPKLEAELRSR